jgi:hypothetical protein
MTERPDIPQHDPLRQFLSRQLDPQLGRTIRHFHARAQRPALARRAGAIVLTAAAAAAVFFVVRGLNGSGHDGQDEAAAPVAPGAPQDALPQEVEVAADSASVPDREGMQPAPADPRVATEGSFVLERVWGWRTLDEGLVPLSDNLSVRKFRRQWLERVAWFDSEHQARLELIIPREQVVLVPPQVQ